MSMCLPYDVHLKILDYLDVPHIHEYSLVCRTWHEPARYVLYQSISLNIETELDAYVDALDNFLTLGRYAKKLKLYMSPRYECWSPSLMKKRAQQYATLIRHTPHVQSLIIEESTSTVAGIEICPPYLMSDSETFPLRQKIDPFYQIVSQAISDGYWQSLCYICDHFFMTKDSYRSLFNLVPERCIPPDYYTTLSAIRNRITSVALNISSTTNLPSEPHCFQFPHSITKETRFSKARELDCYSSKKTTIRCLDNALGLCPTATKVFIKLQEFHKGEDKLTEINPNMTVKSLKIHVYSFTKGLMDYIYRKFPRVIHFELHIAEDVNRTITQDGNLFELPTETINQLVNYLCKMEKFWISHCLLSNQMEVLEALSRPQWRSKLHISLPKLHIMFNELEKNSNVHLFKEAVEFSYTPNIGAFLNQLDALTLTAETIESSRSKLESYAHILQSCKQLKTLTLKNFVLTNFPELVSPIINLKVLNCRVQPEFWTHISRYMPDLKNLLYVIDWRESFRRRQSLEFVVKMDMPFTSLNRLSIGKMPTLAGPGCFVQLIQSGEKTYWTNMGKKGRSEQLFPIESSEYEEKKLEKQFPILNLTCIGIESFWQIV
ncbi:hypothetical protein BD560DRAFT_407082 [Blakeslea trispora]|nr:hypothetical protein BD560DRAFT_407082 [Blakeslea trispora]